MRTVKKIIFVTVSMRGGGTERVISILANHMVQNGTAVTIVMIADPTIEYFLDERIKTVCVSKATGGSLVGRIKRIWNMRREFTSDKDTRIISMGTVANMFTLVASIGLRNPIMISERNDPNRLNHRPIKKYEVWLRNLLYIRADKLVLQTPDVKECFPISIQKKSVVIPNPISSELPEANADGKREKTVITAGRLTEQKNHKLLINAFCKFHKMHPEYRLKIYGKGELEEELKQYIQRCKADQYIAVCGFCDDLYGRLQTEGMYVSSSDWEGISNSLIEALAMGIPTIATDCPVGGSRMFIKNEYNGLLIDTGDEEALVAAMTRIAEDEAFEKTLGNNAVQIRDDLSVEKIVGMWLQPSDDLA